MVFKIVGIKELEHRLRNLHIDVSIQGKDSFSLDVTHARHPQSARFSINYEPTFFSHPEGAKFYEAQLMIALGHAFTLPIKKMLCSENYRII